MLTVLDCNNFWSPSGGGVRRYHLEKMEYYKSREDIRYVFVMHDSKTYSEQIGKNATIEHIKVPKVPGNWEYRYLFKRTPLERVILKYDPDIIEVGSPYVLPSIVNAIVTKNNLQTKVMGFWHADFPVTYIGRFLKGRFFSLQKTGEQLAWKFARKHYNSMDGVMVASRAISERMADHGIKNLHFSPLGVNSRLFNPDKRDEKLIEKLRDGEPGRLILFFAHRFSKEKGLHTLLEAYDLLVQTMNAEPALILAGTGPYENLVRKAASTYKHVHFAGYIHDKEEMARYYASADIGFALSEWETFGLSLVEALSCGLPLISSGQGAAPEHVIESGAGIILKEVTPAHIADAIGTFSKTDRSGWKLLARRYAESMLWNKSFDNQADIYKKVLDEK